jgi:MFS family permease
VSQTDNARIFTIVWLGQSLSLIGTGITGFALGVWIYQSTGSVTQFTLVAVFGSLPGLLLSPFFGVALDIWDRRTAMILSDTFLGLRTVGIAVLYATGNLEVWHIYVAVVLRSIFEGIQIPAYSTSVSLLVPKEKLGKANGRVQFSDSAAGILAPALAGLLMPVLGLVGLLIIDIVTFLLAIASLFAVRFPKPKKSTAGKQAQGSIWRRAAFGWHYIRGRRGLLTLVLFFAVLNLCLGSSFVLLTPLVLSFAGAPQLGLVMSIGSAGSILGSFAMSTWGGPKKKTLGVLGFAPLVALGLVTIGLQPSVPLIAVGVAAFFAGLPIVNASSLTIWQRKVEQDVQGRVFATRKVIGQCTSPIAYLCAGPLADRVFEPAMAAGGTLAATFGAFLGTGPGRGMAVQFVLVGTVLLVASLAGLAYTPLREVESRLPDAVSDDEAG